MAAPTKLFLEFNDIDGQFHVNDKNGFAFGQAHEIPDAIQHARTVTNAPIDIGDSHAGFTRLSVTKKPDHAEEDSEVFIQMLAELGGIEIIKLFDENLHFIGYTMQLAEDDITAAEIAAEQHEAEQVSALGSYLGDD